MADDLLTMADLVSNSLDVSERELNSLANASPFVSALPLMPSSNGTVHKYSHNTAAPVVGFRAENSGRDMDHSVDTLVTVNLKILDFSWQVDKAVADGWIRGGPAAFVAREGLRHLRQALFAAEIQYINCTTTSSGGSAAGFAGFADNAGLNALSDSMVLGHGGTGSDLSSVYMMNLGEDGVMGVIQGDNPIQLGDTVVQQRIEDPGTTNTSFPTYYTPACSWLGMQVGGSYSVARYANIESAGNTFDDDDLYSLLKLFPVGHRPTHVLMNRAIAESIRQNRTATTAMGSPAPRFDTWEDLSVIITDALVETETAIT